MQEKKQRYNKGSERLPIEEHGKANYRHFARAVSRRRNLDVVCTPNYVKVIHNNGICPTLPIEVAQGFDMACTLDDHGEAYFEYVGNAAHK